jgi:hypothetical protein
MDPLLLDQLDDILDTPLSPGRDARASIPIARQDSLTTHVPSGVKSFARERGKGDDVVQRLAHVRLDFHESPSCFSTYPQLHSHLVCLVSLSHDSLSKRVTGGYSLL